MFILPGARSPGEPGQTYLSICFFSLCAHEFISSITSLTLKTHLLKKLLLLFPPHPPPGARSPGETKVNLRRDISFITSSFLYYYFFVCLFFVRKLLHSNDTNKQQKNKCRLLTVQRTQTYSYNKSFPADEHLPFLFCSLVNLCSVSSSCFFVCLTLFLFMNQHVFLLALFIDLFRCCTFYTYPSTHHLSI